MPTTQQSLMTPADVSRALGVTTETLRRWRRNGSGPAWVRLGPRFVRYETAAVRSWLDMRSAA